MFYLVPVSSRSSTMTAMAPAALVFLIPACARPTVEADVSAEGTVRIEDAVPVDAVASIKEGQAVPIEPAAGSVASLPVSVTMRQAVPVEGAITLEGPIQVQVAGPSVAYEGTFISEAMMDLVEEGETSGEWVLAVFGEPDFRAALSNGEEIWRWTYRPVRHQSALLDLFNIGDDEEKEPRPEHVTAFVTVRDGMVVSKWRE